MVAKSREVGVNTAARKQYQLSQGTNPRGAGQHSPCRAGMTELYGVRNLWAAVLRQAIKDAQSSQKGLAHRALGWICSHDDGPGSFSFACMAIDVSPHRVRRTVAVRLRRSCHLKDKVRTFPLKKALPSKPIPEGAAEAHFARGQILGGARISVKPIRGMDRSAIGR